MHKRPLASLTTGAAFYRWARGSSTGGSASGKTPGPLGVSPDGREGTVSPINGVSGCGRNPGTPRT